jgi:hypothetical protein
MLGYFNGVLESTLDEYLNLISTKHGIKFSELKILMNEVKGRNSTGGDITVAAKLVQVKDGQTCSFMPQRGKNVGTVCGKKVKKDSEFCTVHSKKTTVPPATIEVETKDAPIPKKPNPVLRKNHIINKWWHPDSGLVFKSSEEKIVIGIYKDEQICDLSDEDVAACVAYKFKYVTKRKRNDDEDDSGEKVKKQKVEKKPSCIDEQFIKVNQDARNVEVIIKGMFDTKPTQDDDDEADDDEHEDPFPDWDNNGVEETKDNFTVQVEEDEDYDVAEEDVYEEELLLEEEDS